MKRDFLHNKSILAIDVGNTNVLFAIISASGIGKTFRLSTVLERTSDEYLTSIIPNFLDYDETKNIQDVIICSVVPSTTFELKRFIKNIFKNEPKLIGEDINPDLKILTQRPEEVGSDRLVNSLAAYKLYGGEKIIIDFGTATTFDVINKEGSYLGGVIAPGIELSLDSLDKATARLPRIAVKKPNSIIGKDTVSAMQSGIYWGYIGLLEGIISRIKREIDIDMDVIATGGLASLFFKDSKLISKVDSDLTIKGIAYTWNPSLDIF